MQELRFTELDEGGRLVVVTEDGTAFAVPVDDRLRAALRRRPQAADGGGNPSSSATPREVQSMIRAGQTAEEVASATGWELARVRRFEGPVLAEREHVVGLAKVAHVRAQGRTDGSHTLERRVRERLQSRGVQPAGTRWDAARSASQGPWTVVVSFSAGGRERQAAWHYDVQDRSIDALDDEARWLSEDEQALPGGLAGHPLLGTSTAEDETADLMAAMRERRQARGRRGRRADAGRGDDRGADPGVIDNEPLPLEDLQYDPASMGDPPAAHPRGPVGEGRGAVAAEPSEAEERGQDAAQGGTHDDEPRARRERRRLRIPRLPAVLGDPQDEDRVQSEEIAYARTHDPQEVSFDEFFGTDEDEVDVAGAQDHADLVGDLELVTDLDVDPQDDGEHDRADDEVLGEDEPVDEVEDDPSTEVDDHVAGDAQPSASPVGAVPDGSDDDAGTGGSPEPEPEPDPEPAAPSGRRKGRPSVPSWDDIMFGGGDRRRG